MRVLAAAALAVDAAVHASLPRGYQSAAPEGIGEGNLFLAEAAAAAAAGLYVLIRGSRPAWALALLTAGGGLAALLLYRYLDIPAFGPFPAMYEPIWFPEKTLTALAQGPQSSSPSPHWSNTGKPNRDRIPNPTPQATPKRARHPNRTPRSLGIRHVSAGG